MGEQYAADVPTQLSPTLNLAIAEARSERERLAGDILSIQERIDMLDTFIEVGSRLVEEDTGASSDSPNPLVHRNQVVHRSPFLRPSTRRSGGWVDFNPEVLVVVPPRDAPRGVEAVTLILKESSPEPMSVRQVADEISSRGWIDLKRSDNLLNATRTNLSRAAEKDPNITRVDDGVYRYGTGADLLAQLGLGGDHDQEG